MDDEVINKGNIDATNGKEHLSSSYKVTITLST